MSNIKEFSGNPVSLRKFWLIAGPVTIGLLYFTMIVALWRRPWAIALRSSLGRSMFNSGARADSVLNSSRPSAGRPDIESQASSAPDSWEQASHGPLPSGITPVTPAPACHNLRDRDLGPTRNTPIG